MTRTRAGLLIGLGLAAGLAIGTVGTSLAASPSPTAPPAASTPWAGMMGGWGGGMMGAWTSGGSTPSTTFGPGVMSSLGADWTAMANACDAMHDAIFGPDSDSPEATPAPDAR